MADPGADQDAEAASAPDPVAGVIISGGQSRRWGGGDKFLAQLGGRTLLSYVAARVRPQVCMVVLNANGRAAQYRGLEMAVVPDTVRGDRGPLAGVLTGLDWVRETLPGVPWVLTVPSDAPFLPLDLAARLLAAVVADGADLACAASQGRTHPVIGLWPVALCDRLRHGLMIEDERKIDAWTAAYRVAQVEWPADPVDPFFNVNTRDDLARAQELLGQLAP
jgi:molybdopterin-guanine dinucleotide biosynthesis protein A